MRNTVSTVLLGIGILFIVVGFISGIAFAQDQYGNFFISVAFYYWLSGIIAGFLFIGFAEIINLLQKLLDKGGVSAPASVSAVVVRSEGDGSNTAYVASTTGEIATGSKDSETKIKDLTIVIDGERFKGQFWITPTEVKVMKKSMFQADSDAQLVKVISKSTLSSEYVRNKDYFVFNYRDGDDVRRLEYMTQNVYDYDRILSLLTSRG